MKSTLRNNFRDFMVLRGFSQNTMETYIHSLEGLVKYYHLQPNNLDYNQIQKYLLFLIKERKLSDSTITVIFSGLRCFYSGFLYYNNQRLA